MLDVLEDVGINNSGISVRPSIAGGFQKPLDLVLIPERGFRTERNALAVERIGDFLIREAVNIQRGDSLCHNSLLWLDDELTLLD